MEDLHINKKHSNIIKGIAILFVILGHMNYIDCAGPWGVHLFLILSGYGIYCSLEINGVKDFWKKRIQAVFLPYLFCTIFFLFIRFILNEKISFIMVIVSLLGLDFDMNVDSTMWYISYIFACYAMVWVIMKLKVKNKYAAICIGMLLWLCITIAGYKGFIWHKGTIAWAYVFSFPLGLFWARYRKKQISSKLKKMICGVMTTVCIAIVILDYDKPHSGIEELIFTFSAALAVLLFSQIISFYKVPIIKGGGYTKHRNPLIFYVFK